jgi:tetratricopeptide (TPR) repeat protein
MLTNMKIKSTVIGLMSFLVVGLVQAQENWNWPSDTQMEAKAREYNAAYNDYLKSEEFLKAKGPLFWLLTNAPDLNEALYINGVKVYEGAAEAVSDEAEMRVYQDSVITLYDKRKELYDNEERWIANKAYYAYKFYKGDKDKVGMAADLFGKTMEIDGTMHPSLISAYFDAIYRNFAFNQAYTPVEVIEKYEFLMSKLDEAEKNGENVATSKGTLEQLLAAMDIIDCDFIERNMGPKLKEDPTNLKVAKQIFQYSVQEKCTSSEIFLLALETIDNDSPTFNTSQVRGLRYMQNSEYAKAGELFEKALTLATTDEQRAEIQWDMAKVHANLGRKSQARQAALRAAELNPERESDAYSFVGGLIMTSSNECRGGQSRVKDYSIYIAAYNAYSRAGDSTGMANAKSRFPSKEELFTEGFQVGDTIETGCWVGQTVTLATRD